MSRFLFGHGISGSENSGDNYVSSPHGALSAKTKNTGDGFWCPNCFESGKFTWINPDKKYPRCGVCKTERDDMDEQLIAEIMRSH